MVGVSVNMTSPYGAVERAGPVRMGDGGINVSSSLAHPVPNTDVDYYMKHPEAAEYIPDVGANASTRHTQ